MARHFSQLVVWQLADAIRTETVRLTNRPRFIRDVKLHDQAEDAANSACRNIAEGFGCQSHREFARFLEISRRSLNELQDAFEGATRKGYLKSNDLATIQSLLNRLYPALSRLLAYLRRS